MNWSGWENFWAMGGYAPFVWGAFGVTAFAVALELLLLRLRRRHALRDIEQARRRLSMSNEGKT